VLYKAVLLNARGIWIDKCILLGCSDSSLASYRLTTPFKGNGLFAFVGDDNSLLISCNHMDYFFSGILSK
jgi:hypothetical protein